MQPCSVKSALLCVSELSVRVCFYVVGLGTCFCYKFRDTVTSLYMRRYRTQMIKSYSTKRDLRGRTCASAEVKTGQLTARLQK